MTSASLEHEEDLSGELFCSTLTLSLERGGVLSRTYLSAHKTSNARKFLSRLLAYSASPGRKTLKLTLPLFGGQTDRLVDHHWLSRFWTLQSSEPRLAPFDREYCLSWRFSLQSLFPQSCQTDQIWFCKRFLLWPRWVRAVDLG